MIKNFSLQNKNIILTGAAGILGKKLSQSFLDAGANLALLDVNKTSLDNLNKSLKSEGDNYFKTYLVDLTIEQDVTEIIHLISKKFGTIDVLFNNAATKGKSLEEFLKPFEDYNYNTWKEILEGNLSSMFLTTKAVGKIMKEQKLSADDLQYISDWYMYYGLIAAHKYNEIDIWAWNHTVWPGLNGSYLGQNDPEACRRIYRRILLLAQNERVTPQTRKFTQ